MSDSALTKETRHVQNPALGATLLWRFACGYTESHRTAQPPPVPLAFVVLPLLYHRDTCELITRTQTRSNLATFIEKFSRPDVAKSDVLLSLNDRVLAMRPLSLQSFQMAVRSRLITVIPTSGAFAPLSSSQPSGVASTVRPILVAADRLGTWCGTLTLFEISTALKVDF